MKQYKIDIVEMVQKAAKTFYISDQDETCYNELNVTLAENLESIVGVAFDNGEVFRSMDDWEQGEFNVLPLNGSGNTIGFKVETEDDFWEIEFFSGYDISESWELLGCDLPNTAMAYILLCMLAFCDPMMNLCGGNVYRISDGRHTFTEISSDMASGVRKNNRENTLHSEAVENLKSLREKEHIPIMICEQGGFTAMPSKNLPVLGYRSKMPMRKEHDRFKFDLSHAKNYDLSKVTQSDVDKFENTLILIIEIILNLNESTYLPFTTIDLDRSVLQLVSFLDNIKENNENLLEDIGAYVRGKYDINNRKKWN